MLEKVIKRQLAVDEASEVPAPKRARLSRCDVWTPLTRAAARQKTLWVGCVRSPVIGEPETVLPPPRSEVRGPAFFARRQPILDDQMPAFELCEGSQVFRWIHPDYTNGPHEVMLHYATLVQEGLPGGETEAAYLGSALCRPVHKRVLLEDGTLEAATPLFAGGQDEQRLCRPAVLLQRAHDGAWGTLAAGGPEFEAGPDALFLALLRAAAQAAAQPGDGGVAAPHSVGEARRLTAQRLRGELGCELPIDVAKAQIAAADSSLNVYEPKLRDDGTAYFYFGDPVESADPQACLGMLQCDAGQWAVIVRPRDTACTPDNVAESIVFAPAHASLHACLAFVRAFKTQGLAAASSAAAQADLPALAAKLAATVARKRAAYLQDTRQELQTEVDPGVAARFAAALQSFAATGTPAAVQALHAAQARVDAQHPYSPFRDAHEEAQVVAYMKSMRETRTFGNDLAALALGDVLGVRVRIWSQEGDRFSLRSVSTPHNAAMPITTLETLDVANIQQFHYVCLENWRAGMPLPQQAADLTQVQVTDLGGTGDCLFRAAAHGLNFQGVHGKNRRALIKAAHALRQQVVDQWSQTLSRRGHRAAKLVQELKNAMRDETGRGYF